MRERSRLSFVSLEDRSVPAFLYVAPNGVDDPNLGRTPTQPVRSLQLAVNLAADNDTIKVAAGTYTFNPLVDVPQSGERIMDQVVTILDKRLAIYGGFSTSDQFATANPAVNTTTIDGELKHRGIMVLGRNRPTSLDLQGFLVRNGVSRPHRPSGDGDAPPSFGGGVYIDMGNQPNNTDPIIFRNVTFVNNHALATPLNPTAGPNASGGNASGGAIYSTNVNSLVLDRVTFDSNTSRGANEGLVAGRALGGAIHTNFTKLTGTDLIFRNNQAIGGVSNGAGRGKSNSLLTSFTADATGGAVAFQLSSTATITRALFEGNEARGGGSTNPAESAHGGVGYGAAVFAELETQVTLRDTVVRNNTSIGGPGSRAGFASGAFTFENASLDLDRVAITGNVASGGAPNNARGVTDAVSGGGLYLFSVQDGRSKTPVEIVNIRNTIIADNRVQLHPTSTPNTGGSAAGIRLNGLKATLDHVTITNNTFGPNLAFGQAVMLQNDGGTVPTDVLISNSIIANHQPAPGFDSAAITQFGGTKLALSNNLFFNNRNTLSTPTLATDPAGLGNATTTGLNTSIFADPLLVQEGGAGGAYSLGAGSAAINAAVGSSVTTDLTNKARTAPNDLGALEVGSNVTQIIAPASADPRPQVTPTSPPPAVPPPPATIPVPTRFAAGTGGKVAAQIRLVGRDGQTDVTLQPFGSFTGSVRSAAADVNGDGVDEIVAGTGPGIATRVVVFDGLTQQPLFDVAPFESTFTGGVYVALGDVTGDGRADLVITPDEGGGPRAKVINIAKGGEVIADFFGIDDPNFRGGARAAIGDLNGDGVGDLFVAAGFLGGPRVAGFNGRTLPGSQPLKLFGDFFAFEQSLRNGIFLTVGDINGDGFAELIAGGGPGGGPRILAFNGKDLLSNSYVTAANFFGGDPNNRGGVRLSVKDLDGDNRADIVIGAGTGSSGRATAYLGKNIQTNGTPPAEFDLELFSGTTTGVFVG